MYHALLVLVKSSLAVPNLSNYGHLWYLREEWVDLVQSQILFYMHQQPMVPDHATKYEENPSSHYGGMCEDGLTDQQAVGQLIKSVRLMNYFLQRVNCAATRFHSPSIFYLSFYTPLHPPPNSIQRRVFHPAL